MALTTVIGNRILIILDEENIERIQQFDPWEMDIRKTSGTLPIPFEVVVCYAKKDEYEKIKQLSKPDELLKYLYRGYQYTESDAKRNTEKYDKL